MSIGHNPLKTVGLTAINKSSKGENINYAKRKHGTKCFRRDHYLGDTQMINEKQARKYCREDISKIAGYAEAVADTTQTYICHHRNAEPFTGFCTKDLKKMNMYLQRPASELKFVTYSEHTYIHGKGKHGTMYGKRHSEETRNKISVAMKGKTHSEETRKKLKGKAAWNKGKTLSEDTRKKMSETHNGKHWYNNGIVSTFAKSCPEGFVPGRIRKAL